MEGRGTSSDTSAVDATGTLGGDCPVLQTTDTRIPKNVALMWLNDHNEARHKYCVPPMQWDTNLAKVAQDYAELGAWFLPHNPDAAQQYADLIGCTKDCPEVKENIHFHKPFDFYPYSGCMEGWINEESPTQCNDGGSHYLTMMGARFTHVGCGAWIDTEKRLHVVCDYAANKPYSGKSPFPDANCTCTPGTFVPYATTCYTK